MFRNDYEMEQLLLSFLISPLNINFNDIKIALKCVI